MAEVVVGALTEAAIITAISAAGVGGTVKFPSGEYVIDDLRVSLDNQTWLLDRGAIIKRSNTTIAPIVTVQADGWRLRGGQLDGNRYVNPHTAPGISSPGFSVDMRDFDLVAVKHWGISISDATLVLRDFSIRKTGQAGVYWRINTGSPSRPGPLIEHGVVSRSSQSDYLGSGGILIQAPYPARVVAPEVLYTTVNLPQGNEYAAVAIEILQAERALVLGNNVTGGRIGISFGGTDFSVITANRIARCYSYHVELAGSSTGGSSDNVVTANTIQGMPGVGQAFEVSGLSHRNKIIGNPTISVKRPIRISNDCNNTTFRD